MSTRSYPGGFTRQFIPYEDEPRDLQRQNALAHLVGKINRLREQLKLSEQRMFNWRREHCVLVDGIPSLQSNSVGGAEKLRNEIRELNRQHLALLGRWHELLLTYSQLKENQGGTNGKL